ncbi:MAG: hypothetical protein APF84_10580 [Gracilibacter sp. BRH_c7a]|nr:MAG: hypothetical protein APF84_10580 [Gracilibacter sp. BRH_c7a]
MKNALTIDVEDWYMTQDFNFPYVTWDKYEDRVEYSTNLILDLLLEVDAKATFFVLGCVAARHPELVRRIVQQGHELASHGYTHQMITQMSKEEFRDDLVRSKTLLEEISGVNITCFRAPTWSITESSLWALEVLEEEGFLYDSSIQPFKTHLSGISNAPLAFFHPKVKGKTLRILEVPPTLFEIGPVRTPFAGGLYFRVLPYFIVKYLLQTVNKTRPGVTYFHPWEVDPGQPHLEVSTFTKITHYAYLKNNLGKIKHFLHNFQFCPLKELIVETKEYPVFELS